jgi:competence protein ComEA
MKQVAYVLVGILVGFILAGGIFIVTRAPAGKPIALEPSPTKAPIEVHVIGGVVRPGVYELPEGSRVKDAIEAAGGLLADADPGSMNLAAKVEDGQQLEIPGGESASSGGTVGNTGPFQVVPTAASAAASPTPRTDLLDINTATAEELDSLPGIGPTTAQNIINYRNTNGPFAQIEDIMNVPGLGLATFDQIKDYIMASQ